MSAYKINDEQYIAGQWLKGTSNHVIENINPYHQEIILELHAASIIDVDSAYAAAQKVSCHGQAQQQNTEKNWL